MSNVARSIALIRVLAFNLYKNVYFKIARLKKRAIFVYKRFYFGVWYDYTPKNVVALAGFCVETACRPGGVAHHRRPAPAPVVVVKLC